MPTEEMYIIVTSKEYFNVLRGSFYWTDEFSCDIQFLCVYIRIHLTDVIRTSYRCMYVYKQNDKCCAVY